MDWKSKWDCRCGAIWTSTSDHPPNDGLCFTCDSTLKRLPDKPLLTDAWTKRLGPEKHA